MHLCIFTNPYAYMHTNWRSTQAGDDSTAAADPLGLRDASLSDSGASFLAGTGPTLSGRPQLQQLQQLRCSGALTHRPLLERSASAPSAPLPDCQVRPPTL